MIQTCYLNLMDRFAAGKATEMPGRKVGGSVGQKRNGRKGEERRGVKS